MSQSERSIRGSIQDLEKKKVRSTTRFSGIDSIFLTVNLWFL